VRPDDRVFVAFGLDPAVDLDVLLEEDRRELLEMLLSNHTVRFQQVRYTNTLLSNHSVRFQEETVQSHRALVRGTIYGGAEGAVVV
jgi:hypothetical protein